jgi:transcriptional regulator of arginine metabolism
MMDRERQTLDLRTFINDVVVAQNLVVVKTPPGHAHAVGRAIDLLEFQGLVGTVAGDDTVLIVTLDAETARRFKRHVDALAQGGRYA